MFLLSNTLKILFKKTPFSIQISPFYQFFSKKLGQFKNFSYLCAVLSAEIYNIIVSFHTTRQVFVFV